ncbi:hypothetical protein [Winogradskyella sp.]|uniref:hypothetical protein n=1 Tax=Winogradskyella sp. TaxID=1883156 RepID=UPI003BAA2EEC
MIGDKLTYHSNYRKVTDKIMSRLNKELTTKACVCIAVGGESGSGKTSLAHALHLDIEKKLSLKGFLFHADDYFIRPPKDNHNKRLEDIGNVGVEEVNLDVLDEHIRMFINKADLIEKPLINYNENYISKEIIQPSDYDFCIVEGTYVMLLQEPHFKVFIKKTYKDTMANRQRRARDLINAFNENVLEIEHHIIKAHSKLANMIVSDNGIE